MRKKILVICIVTMFLLVGISSVSVPATYPEPPSYPLVAQAFLTISRNENIVKGSHGIPIIGGTYMEGPHKAELEVLFSYVPSPYRIEGTWGVQIKCYNSEDIYFFNHNLVSFDYGYGEDPPNNKHDFTVKNLPGDIYTTYIHIDISIDVYENEVWQYGIEWHPTYKLTHGAGS